MFYGMNTLDVPYLRQELLLFSLSSWRSWRRSAGTISLHRGNVKRARTGTLRCLCYPSFSISFSSRLSVNQNDWPAYPENGSLLLPHPCSMYTHWYAFGHTQKQARRLGDGVLLHCLCHHDAGELWLLLARLAEQDRCGWFALFSFTAPKGPPLLLRRRLRFLGPPRVQSLEMMAR